MQVKSVKFVCAKHEVYLRGHPHWFCQVFETTDGSSIYVPSYQDMWCPDDGNGLVINGECVPDEDWQAII